MSDKKNNAIHWEVLAQLRASDSGCWADSCFVAGDGDRLGYLQTLDKQVTEQRKFKLYEFYIIIHLYVCLHVHIFWKNLLCNQICV